MQSPGTRPVVLVIAATDSSGGAGLTRDVSVLTDFSVDAQCAVTAVTAQSNARVHAVHHVPAKNLRAQIEAAFETRVVNAIKIGMLGSAATVEAVAECLPRGRAIPIVLDPVLAASSGAVLLDGDGQAAMRASLFPRATLLTPNVPEVAAILREDIAISERQLIEQGRRLLALGPQAVLLKGGHTNGNEAVDLFLSENKVQRMASARLDATSRGTGCALASAIAAGLASGLPPFEACQRAKRYVLDILLRP